MRTIKATSHSGQRFIYAIEHSTNVYLEHVYKTYSGKKCMAWLQCRNLCNYENGRGFCIISNNTFGFSVGWKLPNGNYRVETPKNSYLVEV